MSTQDMPKYCMNCGNRLILKKEDIESYFDPQTGRKIEYQPFILHCDCPDKISEEYTLSLWRFYFVNLFYRHE